MARPSKYNWSSIERDYKAGVAKTDLRKRYGVPRNTLDERIRNEKWEVSAHAVKAMSHLREVSEQIAIVTEQCPEILPNLADRIADESPFDIELANGVMLGIRASSDIVKAGKVTTQAMTMDGITDLERSLTNKDINDHMSALQKAKEIKFGREFPNQQKPEGKGEVIEGYEVLSIG